MPDQAGVPITAVQADDYLKRNVSLREALQQRLPIIIPPDPQTGSLDDLLSKLYKFDVNAFIFSKELVESFFSDRDAQGNLQDKANFLMIILGAKINGDSTVVIAGVNENADHTFRSLQRVYAASEQPPTQSLLEFPSSDGNEIIKSRITLL